MKASDIFQDNGLTYRINEANLNLFLIELERDNNVRDKKLADTVRYQLTNVIARLPKREVSPDEIFYNIQYLYMCYNDLTNKEILVGGINSPANLDYTQCRKVVDITDADIAKIEEDLEATIRRFKILMDYQGNEQ